MQILRGRHIGVRELAISPDSRYVAAAGGWGLNVWDLHDPDAEPTLHTGGSSAIRFVSDGRLFSASRAGWRLHDRESGRTVSWQRTNGDGVTIPATSVSPCGQFVLDFDPTGTPHYWRLNEDGLGLHRELVWSRPTGTWAAGFVSAPDGERFATHLWMPGQTPRPSVIHRMSDGEPLARLEGQGAGSNYFFRQFTPDGGKFLAGAKSDIYEWDARAGGPGRLAVRQPGGRWFRGVAVHPDGTTLAGVTSDGVSLFDLASGGLLRTYDWQSSNMRCVAFTPDGTRCAVAEVGNNVLLFDVE